MIKLKELLLPEETSLDFSNVKTRPKLQSFKWKFLIFLVLFSAMMVAYTLIVSLTYQTVLPANNPSYNSTVTLSLVLNDLAPSMVEQGMLASVALNKAVFLNDYSYVTNCDNITLVQDSYVYAPTTNDPKDIGCSLNMTISYTMKYGQQGQYYLVSLNGFSFNPAIYSNIIGDLVLKTSGIIGGTFTTEPVFQILSGIDGQNVMLNTLSNDFTNMVFDLKNILLFGLSSSGIMWKILSLILTNIMSKIKQETRYGELVHTKNGMYIEV